MSSDQSQPSPVREWFIQAWDACVRIAYAVNNDRLLGTSSALAFTTILAIVPLMAVTLSLMTAFPFFSEFEQALQMFLRRQLLPEAFSETVMNYLDEFVAGASKLSAIGAVFLVVTSVMVIMSVDEALNDIWHVRNRRSLGQRLLVYWAALTLGPLILGGTLLATAYVARQAMTLPGSEVIPVSAQVLWLPYLISWAGFCLLFLTVPNRRVRTRDALIGSFVTASLFEVIKWALGVYFALFPTYTLIYGAFSVLPAFLLWVYFSWMAVLLGAVVAANLPQQGIGPDSGPDRSPDQGPDHYPRAEPDESGNGGKEAKEGNDGNKSNPASDMTKSGMGPQVETSTDLQEPGIDQRESGQDTTQRTLQKESQNTPPVTTDGNRIN